MSWLFPAVVATLCGTTILAGTYLYLYLYDRKRFLFIWTVGWAIYGLRFVFMLFLLARVSFLPASVLSSANQLAALASGIFLLWGSYLFLGRKFPHIWIYLSILNIPWILYSNSLSLSFIMQTLPTYTFLGCVYAWTGVVFLRHVSFHGLGKFLTGWAFVIWGIHKADYPFLRPVEWFAPWGYLIGANLEIIVAIGMLLIYFSTTRQQVEQSERDFRMLIENVPIPIAVTDANADILHLNRKFVEGFGYTQQDLRNVNDWFPLAYPDPDYRKRVQAEWERNVAESLAEEKEIDPREYRVTCKDRTEKDVVIWGAFVGKRLITIFNDITERKQSEAALQKSEKRFRDLSENTSDWIWEFDENEVLTYASPRVKNLLGYDPDEIVGKKTAFDLIPSPEKEKVRSEWEELKKSAQPFVALENVNQHKDGRLVVLESSGVPVFDDTGRLCGYRGIDRDITERKNLESQLRQAQKMEAIGTLAGGIAHDFNNILSAILGYAEMAQEDIANSDKARYDLEQVIKASNRAKELVHHILTFSRKTEHDLEPLQISIIAQEALKLLRASIPTTIEIHQDIDPESGYIWADTAQVHQIFMNLCTNASHAMEEKGGTLKVSLRNLFLAAPKVIQTQEIQPGAYVYLSVSDTGIGIDHAVRDRIFDPYFTTKTVGKGSGLGLAVVNGIVESYGGMIAVESELGKGTTFHIFLPRIENVQSEITEVQLPLPTGAGHILFVDDEQTLTNLAQLTLEGLGYSVTVYNSSVQALEAFRAHPEKFDLVITDQTMPQFTGYELARQLLEIRPDIELILCTGYSAAVDEEKAKAIGIREMLLKPIQRSVLAKAVSRVLQNRREA